MKLLPDNEKEWRIYFYLGIVSADLDEFSDSEKYLTELINISPRNPVGYSNLGRIFLVQEKYEEAIIVLINGEKIAPNSWSVMYLLGSAYNRVKNYEKAERALEHASMIRPEDTSTLTVLASVYDNLKKYDESDDLHLLILSRDPTNSTILNNYAYSLSVRGIKLKEALEMAQVAVKTSPKNPAYLDTLGWIYFKLGMIDQSAEYVKRSIEIDQTSAEVLEHMGDIQQELGNMEKAKEYYQRALEADETESTTIEKNIFK